MNLRKAVITGLNGTVAPYAAQELEAHGFAVTAWDRAACPTEDAAAGRRFLDAVRPDWLLHIGFGPPEWAGFLAAECASRGIAAALNRIHGDPWEVRAVDDLALDLRMVDDRIDVPAIERRLGLHG